MMIRHLVKNVKNMPGWRTNKKLFVIESDDWGSTRMPNTNVYKQLLETGIRVDKNNFTKLDTLASSEDLKSLLRVLESVRDKNGNPAIFTPFINVSNPDFQRIIEENYSNYYYETFDRTLISTYGSEILNIWKEGISNGLFVPEYHGREHYNFPMLMQLLQEDLYSIRDAFEKGVVHIPVGEGVIKSIGGLAPTYFYTNPNHLDMLKTSLLDGLKIFKETLGYDATVFVPPNGIFNKTLERLLEGTSIKAIIVDRKRREPDGKGGLRLKSYAFQFGSKNESQQFYYSRNCKFEPVQKSYNLDECLANIGAAFRWGKPAVVSTHRINFVGNLNPENRRRNLQEFEILLNTVIKKWPDVEFISSARLVQELENSLS